MTFPLFLPETLQNIVAIPTTFPIHNFIRTNPFRSFSECCELCTPQWIHPPYFLTNCKGTSGMFGIVSSCLDLLGIFNVGCSYIKHLYSQIIHPLYDFINAELRDFIRLQGTQVKFYLQWENWFSAIHHEEGADACGGLFSDPVGKENAI